MSRRRGAAMGLILAIVLAVLPACATGSASSEDSSGKLSVVAAEDVWGSIASQLGGDRATVTSLVTNPDTDPHDYEPTPTDAREIASARYVITNGIGYDPWADQLV